MRLPTLSAGFFVFLLTSILFVSCEARFGPCSIPDGTAMQRRTMLGEEEDQQQEDVTISGEEMKQDEKANDSPTEQKGKEEEQLKIEEKKELQEIKPEEKQPEEQKKAETKEEEQSEEGKKPSEEKKQETKVADQKKEEPKAWEAKKEEINSEDKTKVGIKDVREDGTVSSEDGSKREEQLLAEALVLEEEEKRVQKEMSEQPKAEEDLKQETTAQDKVSVSLSSKSADEETKQQQQYSEPDGKKEETDADEKKDVSKSEEKKDELVKEDSKTVDKKEETQQQHVKEETGKTNKKHEEKIAEKTPEEIKQSSPTEQKTEEKKPEPIAPDTVKVTVEPKKEDISAKQEEEEQQDETEDKETKLEDNLEESISTESADSSDPDDDYPDFLDEFLRFPERLQQSAEHLKTNVPGWEKLSTNSKDLFNQANEQIKESFTPLIGRKYAPVVAYLVSYGLLLLPLGIVMFLLERVRAILSLQKVLLFINIYIAVYFAALVGVSFILGSEPMDFFRNFSPSSYIFLQLLQAFGYIVFIILQTFDLITTCSSGRIAAKLSATLQWIVVVAVGFHYYVTVFHRAMAKSKPLTSWKVYGLYSISFTILCAFARIERGKKQYIQEGGEGSTKQN